MAENSCMRLHEAHLLRLQTILARQGVHKIRIYKKCILFTDLLKINTILYDITLKTLNKAHRQDNVLVTYAIFEVAYNLTL